MENIVNYDPPKKVEIPTAIVPENMTPVENLVKSEDAEKE